MQVLNDSGEHTRLKFLRNTCYEGVDYGPGLPAGAECDVDSHWAPIFIAQHRAVAVGAAGEVTAAAEG